MPQSCTGSRLPVLTLSLSNLRGIGAPPPGAEVIDLVSSEDEDAQAPPALSPHVHPPPPPAMLAPDLTRREGLYIAQSRLKVEAGPATGSTLQEPGLFTSVALPAAAFVCIYTGTFFTNVEFEGLPLARRDALSRFAVEVGQHNVTVAPPVDAMTGGVDFCQHAAAAANEPSASAAANAFTQASIVEVVGADGGVHSYLICCMFTCRAVAAGEELLWNYGEGYKNQRRQARYEAGPACPEQLIDALRLPSPRARVEAILDQGTRVQDALYELVLSGSDESSGDEWTPVKRRRR